MSYVPDDPPMTPDQRRREIARILAKAVLRLHALEHAQAVATVPEVPADPTASPQEEVDVCATTRPHGSAG